MNMAFTAKSYMYLCGLFSVRNSECGHIVSCVRRRPRIGAIGSQPSAPRFVGHNDGAALSFLLVAIRSQS